MNTFIFVITPEYFNNVAMDVEEYYAYVNENPEEFNEDDNFDEGY